MNTNHETESRQLDESSRLDKSTYDVFPTAIDALQLAQLATTPDHTHARPTELRTRTTKLRQDKPMSRVRSTDRRTTTIPTAITGAAKTPKNKTTRPPGDLDRQYNPTLQDEPPCQDKPTHQDKPNASTNRITNHQDKPTRQDKTLCQDTPADRRTTKECHKIEACPNDSNDQRDSSACRRPRSEARHFPLSNCVREACLQCTRKMPARCAIPLRSRSDRAPARRHKRDEFSPTRVTMRTMFLLTSMQHGLPANATWPSC